MQGFLKRKADILAVIGDGEGDKSVKGSVDAPIRELVNLINRHESFVTTSSCSGRIAVFLQSNSVGDSEGTPSSSKKKRGEGGWVLVRHRKVSPEELISAVSKYTSPIDEMSIPSAKDTEESPVIEEGSDNSEEVVVDLENGDEGVMFLKMEAFVLHVEATTIAQAASLLTQAIQSGYRYVVSCLVPYIGIQF